jgi:L-arabinose isomerase
MNTGLRVGILPLYLKLYDQRVPELRAKVAALVDRLVSGLAGQGIAGVAGEVSRTTGEVRSAVGAFEASGCDAVVTVHLAYSPSLEATDSLCATPLPVVVADTTVSPSFDQSTPPERILTDHGIHGVMDLCSVLRRRGKAFTVVAGPSGEGDELFSRLAVAVRAAVAGRLLHGRRLLRVGPTFPGMGDFDVPEAVLEARLGWEVTQIPASGLPGRIDEAAVAAEVADDRRRWRTTTDTETHARSVRMGLRLRVATQGFDGFSFNFSAFDGVTYTGGTAVPFLEASKAMSRGLGYAGEGDVLTAGLVSALARAFGPERVTFTEIFCPDWAGDSLFLSHMGEMNPAVLVPGSEELLTKPYPWGDAKDPAILVGAMRPGAAVLVDLTVGPEDRLELIAADVEVLPDATHPEMKKQVRGWIRPKLPVPAFLDAYSHAGGTHHHALLYGAMARDLAGMARVAGVHLTEIRA